MAGMDENRYKSPESVPQQPGYRARYRNLVVPPMVGDKPKPVQAAEPQSA